MTAGAGAAAQRFSDAAAIRVHSLYRYPVKSLLGESAESLDLDERGVVGDRLWSVRTTADKIGSGKRTRRFVAVPGLLRLRAASEAGRVRITLPDGETYAVDDPETSRQLSEHFGQPLTLARETDVSHFDDGPVSLLGTGSVAALADEVGQEVDPARFRPNILLAGLARFAEDDLVGHRIRIGEVVLDVTLRSTRCVMIDMETAELPAQPGNLVATGHINDACLGVIANVVRAGRIRVGDHASVGPSPA